MMSRIVQVLSCLLVLASAVLGKNQQAWSRYTYNDEPFSLTCKSDNYTATALDTITWTRHGMSGELKTNDHYELRAVGGVPNMELYFKNVDDDLHGIYVCHIKDSNQEEQDAIVMGVNWGTRRYHEDIDKFRGQIIVGAIAAGCTFVFIIAIGLISHFRYLSEESLEKRRNRKELRLGRENGLGNQGYAGEMADRNPQTNGSGVMETSYVHF